MKVPAGLPMPPEVQSQTPTSRPISGLLDLTQRGTRHFLLMRTSRGEFSFCAKSPTPSPSRDRYWDVGIAPQFQDQMAWKDVWLHGRLSGLIVVCFGRFWVLQTTSEVFTRISPDNSLERLTECGVGLVTDQSSDFWKLFVTPFK